MQQEHVGTVEGVEPPLQALPTRAHIVVFRDGDGWCSADRGVRSWSWSPWPEPPTTLKRVLERIASKIPAYDLTVTNDTPDLFGFDENLFPGRDVEVCLRARPDPAIFDVYSWSYSKQRVQKGGQGRKFVNWKDKLADVAAQMGGRFDCWMDFWVRADLAPEDLFPEVPPEPTKSHEPTFAPWPASWPRGGGLRSPT